MYENVIQGPWTELSEEMDGLLAESSANATIGAMAFPVPDQIALLAVYWKRLTGQEVPYHFEGDINALLAQDATPVMFRRAIERAAARASVSDERRWYHVCELVRKMVEALPDSPPLTEFEARSIGARAHARAHELRADMVPMAERDATLLDRVLRLLGGSR
jgi:hypothetical protein